MSEAEAFERILASLHEAALDPARWPGASALIDDALGTHGNTLACGGGVLEEDFRVYYLWIYQHGQRRQDLERIWLGRHLPQDVRLPRLRRLPYNRLFHVTDLYTGEELQTSEAYNALRTLAHAGNSIDVRLQGPDGLRILWEVNDPMDGEGWSSAQLDWIRRLMPHIRQTACVQQTLTGAHALGATLTELLDTTDIGIIQLDARGRIVAANDRARDVLRSGDGLFDRGRFLFARKPQDDARLQSLLARALPPFGTQGAGGSTTVRRPNAPAPFVLHVNPVGLQETESRMWPVAALVLIVDPASGTVIDPAAAAAAFDLTPMESRVAVMLAQGMTVRKIAETMARKESTIRSHVKHMLAKHGFSRQAELVRLVLSLADAPEARR